MPDTLIVEHFPVGPLGCVCTLLADLESGEAIVVDGGDEAPRIAARLDELGVRATYLVHSHAHVDHIGALGELRRLTGANGLLHPADLPLYATLREQARWLGTPLPELVTLDGELSDGERFRAGRFTLDVLHTPGHTPGSVSFALTRADALGYRRYVAGRHRDLDPHEAFRISRHHERRAGTRPGHDDRTRKAAESLPASLGFASRTWTHLRLHERSKS
jgi:glyoxylase-like metal-dependent hydrolase (beta-lactamase superfamily II)